MFGGDEDIEASKRAELFDLIEELRPVGKLQQSRAINKARAEIAWYRVAKIETGELKKDQAIGLSEEGAASCQDVHATRHHAHVGSARRGQSFSGYVRVSLFSIRSVVVAQFR